MPLGMDDCAELLTILRSKATGYRYSDMVRWLRRADFKEPEKPSGSHRVWVHEGSGRRAQLVEHGAGDLLPVYVKRACRVMREANQCQN
jgi:predicted RNA binding protein YcfA (HicA-like mRNA interferase family)